MLFYICKLSFHDFICFILDWQDCIMCCIQRIHETLHCKPIWIISLLKYP